MKIFVEIEVDNGDFCTDENDHGCPFLRRAGHIRDGFYCKQFSHDGAYWLSKNEDQIIKKHPACLTAPKAMKCGHHPDAGVDYYLPKDSDCAACEQE